MNNIKKINGMKKSIRHERGFNLMELIVMVTIIAILSAFSVPQFNSLIRNQAILGVSTEMLATMQTARTEAIKRSEVVKVCFFTEGEDDCKDPGYLSGSANSTDNIDFLKTFFDKNDNNAFDAGDTLIAESGRFRNGIYLRQESGKNIKGSIEFTQRGLLNFESNSSLTAAYILVCDDRADDAVGRMLTLTASGRSSISAIPTSTSLTCAGT